MKQMNASETISKTSNGLISSKVIKENNLSKEDVWNKNDSIRTSIITALNRMCLLKFDIFYPSRYGTQEEKISDLHKQYTMKFSRLSRDFEKWTAQRRLTIKKLRNGSKAIEHLKSTSCKGRLFFSAADAIVTVGAMALKDLKPSWTSKILVSAGTFGLVSFAFGIADLVKTRRIIQDAINEYEKDIECLRDVRKIFEVLSNCNEGVQELFSHGVDRISIEALKYNAKFDSDVRKEFKAAMEELFPHDENVDICSAILLTNAKRNPKLLEDDDFLATVLVFSRSTFAEKWWNRISVEERLHRSARLTGLNRLQALLKDDLYPIQALPLLSTPVKYLNGMPTAIAVLLNGLVTLNASLELTDREAPKESQVLRKLADTLKEEYDELDEIFDLLNPYCD